jgi:transposase, IS5 family
MESAQMRGKQKRQQSFFAGPIYEAIVPKDHLLRRLMTVVDWESLAGEVSDCYSDVGRPSWPPEQMLKIVVLQYIYDRSDRQVAEDLRYHLAMKFFVGLEVDQPGPDNGTISRFRTRLGAERFARLFNRVVEAARAAGHVDDELHAVDSTVVSSKVNQWRWRDSDDDPPPGEGVGGFVKWEGPRLSRGPDTDACFGCKGKDKRFHGYKAHISVDVASQMVVRVVTTPGNEHDGEIFSEVMDPRAAAVTADKIYDQQDNHKLLKKEKIEDRIILNKRGCVASGLNRDRSVVERVNAWLKRWCGGGRARYWGLEKVSIQMLLAATALNLKRLVRLSCAVDA